MADIPGIPPIPIAAGDMPNVDGPPPVQPVAPYQGGGALDALGRPWAWANDASPLPDALPQEKPPAQPQTDVDAFGRPWVWAQPAPYEGHDVPEVPGGAALALQHKPEAAAAPQGQVGVVAPAQGAPAKPTAAPAEDPYIAAQQKAAEEQKAAARAEAEATKAKNDYLAAQTIKDNDVYNQRVAEADKARLEANQVAKAKTAQLTQEAQDIANTRMDSNRIWKGGAGFAGALSMGIGAILAGATTASIQSGQNPVVDLAMKLVDRDLQTQAQDLANRREGLNMKRGLLADEVAQGREDYDIKFKAAMTGLEQARNAMNAYAARFDNPVIDAKTAQYNAGIDAAQATLVQNHLQQGEATHYQRWKDEQELKLQRGQQAIGWYNAKTSRMGQEAEAQARKDAADQRAAAQANAGKEFPIYGAGGPKAGPVGYAKGKDEAAKAEVMLQAQGELRDLYEEGRKIFSDDYAITGSKRRAEQEAWNTKWKNANFRAATGRTDAPSAGEVEAFGIDPSKILGNHMDRLEAGYNTARTGVPGRLRSLGVDDATLQAQGIVDPPEAPTPGVTDTTVYYDEATKTYNRDGRGTPLPPDQSARILADPNYAVQQKGAPGGVYYDAATKTYNVKGIGERLSPSAEAQVRAQPDKFPIVRGP